MSGTSEEHRELSGKRAVVTGASAGIGRAIALELAAAGADLLVHSRQSKQEAHKVASLAGEHHVRTAVQCADLSNPTSCLEFVDQAYNALGGCEIWVNNAGADILTGANLRLSFEEKLEALLSVDVRGTMLLSREVGKRMQAAAGGVILNMGWDQAQTGMEGDSGQLFGAAKAAVMAFTKSLAVTFAPQVRANCLAPGWIRTAWAEQARQRWQHRAVQEAPLARWGTPEDVARAARFLCSPAAAFITGQVVRINGGAIR